MNKKAVAATLVVLPLVLGGLVAASVSFQAGENRPSQAPAQGFICPVTGEELPCPACCVLNERRS